MQFAVNYSRPAAELLQAGKIEIDRFKCPAWPDLVAEARRMHPVYVHFPLKVGPDFAGVIDSETGLPPDWARVETLLARTDTPLVNLHLVTADRDGPRLPAGEPDPELIDAQVEHVLDQLRPAVSRYGADLLILENSMALWPEAVARIVRESGCGFLFDEAHAVMASRALGMDLQNYCQGLPLERTRELHIVGVQRLEGYWLERARTLDLLDGWLKGWEGCLVDHLPMVDGDWETVDWVLDKIRQGSCGDPWVSTFEYGGVGGFFDLSTESQVLAEQVPKLHRLLAAFKRRTLYAGA